MEIAECSSGSSSSSNDFWAKLVSSLLFQLNNPLFLLLNSSIFCKSSQSQQKREKLSEAGLSMKQQFVPDARIILVPCFDKIKIGKLNSRYISHFKHPNNEVGNIVAGVQAAETMDQEALGRVQPGAGASSSGGLTGSTNETPGDQKPLVKMLRKNNPVLHHDDRSFWKYVEKMDDGHMVCKFCGHGFAKDTSISRIKFHLAGVKGRGVRICGQVPQDVQDAALAAIPIDGPPEKKLKNVAGSSNNEVTNAAQQQNNEMEHLERPSFNQDDEPRGDPSQPTNNQLCSPSVTNDVIVNDPQNIVGVRTEPVVQQCNAGLDNLSVDAGRTQVGVQGMEQCGEEGRVYSHLDMEKTGEGSVQHVDRIVPPMIDENCNRREATERLVQPGVGASSFGVYGNQNAISTTPQEQNNEVDNVAGDAGTTPAAATMGHAPGRSVEEFSRWLMEDDIDNGIGGIARPGAGASSSGGLRHNPSETRGAPLLTGSTKLVGRAFEENRDVIWSWLTNDEVSTIGIYGMGGAGKTTMLKHIYNKLLQSPDISRHVYWVTVSQDFSIRKLQNTIAKRIKLYFSNEEEEPGHRAAELSQELMKKQRWILILDDLWKSFELLEVGIPVPLKGCKLLITTRSKEICRQMNSKNNVRVNPLSNEEAWTLFMEEIGHDRPLSPQVEQVAEIQGVDGMHEWRYTLEELKQSKVPQDKVEEEVFQILRFSYTHLSDEALQECFLYCGLFPEDFEIHREDLIDYLIDEGLVKGKSREAEINKGHTMLDRLERACLLERLGCGHWVKMHDLIRDMAIQILEENSRAIVKAGAQLKELPDAEEWSEKLTSVSLMHNQIEEIRSGHSPRCPNLSTLFLHDNRQLGFIADSFFKQLHGLKVLDLSRTNIECLPDSVSDLEGLTSLLLTDCWRLSSVPSLKKLRALKRLDLSNARLKKFPHGMECLSNLRYLRMNGCGEKKFPGGILPKLSRLHVFILEEWIIDGVGAMHEERYAPVTVEGKEVGCLRKLERLECHFEDQSNYLENLKSQNATQSLRTYKIVVGELTKYDGRDLKNNYKYRGSKVVFFGNLNTNRYGDFLVHTSNDIQQLICKCIDAGSIGDDFPVKYSCMERLVISSWFCSAPLPQPSPSYNGIFSTLKLLSISGCKSMKKLFPPVLLQYLINLEEIKVEDCEKMEEIIGGTRSDEEGAMGEESSEFKLPKLRNLTLSNLPELKSICISKLICDSLTCIEVNKCNSIEILFPSSRSCFLNLENITVEECEKMEEIIGGTRSDEKGVMGEESISSEFKLPKLRVLYLTNLPELKSICREKKICDSLEIIGLLCCEKLKRIPICLPLLENGQPSPPPSLQVIRINSKEWWESTVEWEHPNAKDVLHPFVRFEPTPSKEVFPMLHKRILNQYVSRFRVRLLTEVTGLSIRKMQSASTATGNVSDFDAAENHKGIRPTMYIPQLVLHQTPLLEKNSTRVCSGSNQDTMVPPQPYTDHPSVVSPTELLCARTITESPLQTPCDAVLIRAAYT
uniref:Uncharacterized protein n=1 Tax=Salix viminalis TaxID=40686 RepID=A0A6N2M6W5_SALVM